MEKVKDSGKDSLKAIPTAGIYLFIYFYLSIYTLIIIEKRLWRKIVWDCKNINLSPCGAQSSWYQIYCRVSHNLRSLAFHIILNTKTTGETCKIEKNYTPVYTHKSIGTAHALHNTSCLCKQTNIGYKMRQDAPPFGLQKLDITAYCLLQSSDNR